MRNIIYFIVFFGYATSLYSSDLLIQSKKEIDAIDFVDHADSIKPIEKQFTLESNNLVTAFGQDVSADMFSFFLRPIDFSKEGISYYFTYTYNHDQYPYYLSYNLSHMIQFLEFGQKNNQSQLYAKSIIKLFLQKIKGCDYMNSYSFLQALPALGNSLEFYMINQEAGFLSELQKSLKQRFSNIFSTYMSYFQKNPDAFLDALSEQIAKKTNEVQTQQHIDVEQVKKDFLRFLELSISKLIWSPAQAYQAWESIHEIAKICEQFLHKKLISDLDALDDIYWSLVHRFCYFIDLCGQEISQQDLIRIIDDIATQRFVLFAVCEQEHGILTKKQFLIKKIKHYSSYEYQIDQHKYKIYTAQTILDSIDDKDKQRIM